AQDTWRAGLAVREQRNDVVRRGRCRRRVAHERVLSRDQADRCLAKRGQGTSSGSVTCHFYPKPEHSRLTSTICCAVTGSAERREGSNAVKASRGTRGAPMPAQ